MQPGINVPSGAISGTGWFAFSTSTTAKTWQGKATNRDSNRIAFTKPVGNHNSWFREAYSLTTKQQFSVDSKIDDGLPYQGTIVDMSGSHVHQSPNCATASSNEFGSNPAGTTTVNAEYDLSYKELACMMFVDLE